MLELIRKGQNLKSTAPAEMCAPLEYYAVYGGNLRITSICMICNIPKERRSHLPFSGSLKSCCPAVEPHSNIPWSHVLLKYYGSYLSAIFFIYMVSD